MSISKRPSGKEFLKDFSKFKQTAKENSENSENSMVSFIAKIPEPLNKAMATFIKSRPNWDQYRLIEAALSGFLSQNGVDSRSINRIYYKKMFSKKSF